MITYITLLIIVLQKINILSLFLEGIYRTKAEPVCQQKNKANSDFLEKVCFIWQQKNKTNSNFLEKVCFVWQQNKGNSNFLDKVIERLF